MIHLNLVSYLIYFSFIITCCFDQTNAVVWNSQRYDRWLHLDENTKQEINRLSLIVSNNYNIFVPKELSHSFILRKSGESDVKWYGKDSRFVTSIIEIKQALNEQINYENHLNESKPPSSRLLYLESAKHFLNEVNKYLTSDIPDIEALIKASRDYSLKKNLWEETLRSGSCFKCIARALFNNHK